MVLLLMEYDHYYLGIIDPLFFGIIKEYYWSLVLSTGNIKQVGQ